MRLLEHAPQDAGATTKPEPVPNQQSSSANVKDIAEHVYELTKRAEADTEQSRSYFKQLQDQVAVPKNVLTL
jgi:hypothetical protein